MSIVVANNYSHPALLPPTPPMTPLDLKAPVLARRSPLTPSSPLSPVATPTLNTNAKKNAKAKANAGTKTPPTPVADTNPAKPAPVHSYAMLRAFHATAIKYVINKLRWEQTHNGYIPNADAWNNHTTMINKLEDELKTVECAQKGLDKFPNCYYPIADAIKHGPVTLETVVAKEMKDSIRDKMIDKELERVYPFFRQLNIGPKTKAQEKARAELREILMSGGYYPDDLEELLPTENLRRYHAGEPFDIKPSPKVSPKPSPRATPGAAPAPVPAPAPAPKPKRLTYDEARVEKENAKIAQQLKDKGIETPTPVKIEYKKIGPLTKEEYLASLPRYGPKTRGEAMLPIQREQRQIILAWLRQPWGEYDEEAAALIHKMGTLAFARLEEKDKKDKAAKGGGGGGKVVKEKDVAVKRDEKAKAVKTEKAGSEAKKGKSDEKLEKAEKAEDKGDVEEKDRKLDEKTVRAEEAVIEKETQKVTKIEVQAAEIIEVGQGNGKGEGEESKATEVVITQKGEDEATVVEVVEIEVR
jgi:hypothetical protein